MKAELIYRDKKKLASGAIMEMVVWKLPETSAERPHGYKYRLYYGKEGTRLVQLRQRAWQGRSPPLWQP